MVRIAIDAGHGINTAGKRTPDGEREWAFNDKVARAAIARLNTYQGVEILRVDDPTGKTDVPLATRTNRANAWKAAVYVSLHHNAMTGRWGAHGGVETFVYNGANANPASQRIANVVHPLVVTAMSLRNRGVKKANYHVLREFKQGKTVMPAILVEGGFMDSTTDILAMRNDAKLKAQGEAVADGLAAYYKLKDGVDRVSNPKAPASGQQGVATVTVAKLSLRNAPSVSGKFIRDLKKGESYKVWDEKNGWLRLGNDMWASWQNGKYMDWTGKPKPAPKPVPKPAPKPTPAPAKPKASDVYRVIVDGKQVGAYGEDANVTEQVEKALKGKAKDIRIQKV